MVFSIREKSISSVFSVLLIRDEHIKQSELHIFDGKIVTLGKNMTRGLVFKTFNTLFDENASCHFALGNAITSGVEGALKMSKEELEKNNINTSLTHVDFMVGAKDLKITGIKEDGTEVPVFVDGNWA